jgi:hypothetical protein
VVLLIDQRYGHEHYRAMLPGHWSPVRVGIQEKFAENLRGFWGS